MSDIPKGCINRRGFLSGAAALVTWSTAAAEVFARGANAVFDVPAPERVSRKSNLPDMGDHLDEDAVGRVETSKKIVWDKEFRSFFEFMSFDYIIFIGQEWLTELPEARRQCAYIAWVQKRLNDDFNLWLTIDGVLSQNMLNALYRDLNK